MIVHLMWTAVLLAATPTPSSETLEPISSDDTGGRIFITPEVSGDRLTLASCSGQILTYRRSDVAHLGVYDVKNDGSAESFHGGMTVFEGAPPVASDPAQAPRFAIYRVNLAEGPSGLLSEGPTAQQWGVARTVTQDHFLEAAIKRGEPVLTERDIERYCWRTQRLDLTPQGAARWNALGGYDVPLSGLPLLIEVDGRPRYGALLWNPLSSLGSRLPQFWCRTLDDRLVAGGLFVSAEGDTTHAENYDPAVRSVMSELGKLSLDCGDR